MSCLTISVRFEVANSMPGTNHSAATGDRTKSTSVLLFLTRYLLFETGQGRLGSYGMRYLVALALRAMHAGAIDFSDNALREEEERPEIVAWIDHLAAREQGILEWLNVRRPDKE